MATILGLVAFALVACGGPQGVSRSVIVTPTTATIEVGGTVALNATVSGSGANDVTWSSNAPTVASVTGDGQVTGVSAGQVVVSATLASDPSKSGSATITVTTGANSRTPGALTDIDGGLTHTVALDVDGNVWAWGANLQGQLGIGVLPSLSQEPLEVAMDDVIDVAAGDHFTLALKADGSVWAWGSNSHKQLGSNATSTLVHTPVQVADISNAIAIDAAAATGMALIDGGTVMMWGANFGGLLGRQSFTPVDDAVPAVIKGLPEVVAISIGGTSAVGHAMALTDDGEVWTWGDNGMTALGQPTSTPANASATKVSGLGVVTQIAAGQSFSMVIEEGGAVKGWGAAGLGQLGAGDIGAFSQAPVAADVSGIVAIAAGQQHAHALHSDGTVSSWGSNGFGRLGIGVDSGFHLNPVKIEDVDFDRLATGVQFSLGLDASGTPWGWGANLSSQLGVAIGVDTSSPVSIW